MGEDRNPEVAQVIYVIDNSNREWADAPDLDNAIFAMKHIAAEEHKELRAVDEDGKVLAWCFMPTPTDHYVIQTAQP